MSILRTLGLALLLTGSSMAADAVTLTEHFDQSYPLKAGGLFSIVNINGQVIVEAWDQETVSVSAVKEVRAESDDQARDVLKAVRIEVAATAGQVKVETKMPEHNGLLDWLTGHHVQMKVDYTIHVPRNLDLRAETTNGHVAVSGTNGKADVETTNGSIQADHVAGKLRFESTNGTLTLKELAGAVEASTTNGSIRADLGRVEGDLKFETTNGSIALALPHSVRASIDAETTNGTVHSDFEVVGSRATRRHVSGDINGGGGRVVLGTTNGSIRITSAS
jgi:DUF4097 and DUF4098 domain-containing protein YvlB